IAAVDVCARPGLAGGSGSLRRPRPLDTEVLEALQPFEAGARVARTALVPRGRRLGVRRASRHGENETEPGRVETRHCPRDGRDGEWLQDLRILAAPTPKTCPSAAGCVL